MREKLRRIAEEAFLFFGWILFAVIIGHVLLPNGIYELFSGNRGVLTLCIVFIVRAIYILVLQKKPIKNPLWRDGITWMGVLLFLAGGAVGMAVATLDGSMAAKRSVWFALFGGIVISGVVQAAYLAIRNRKA